MKKAKTYVDELNELVKNKTEVKFSVEENNGMYTLKFGNEVLTSDCNESELTHSCNAVYKTIALFTL